MPQLRFRHFPVYVDSKKIAEAESATLDYTTGDEQMHGQDGLLGFSDGSATGSLKLSTVTPTKGHEKDLDKFALEKKDAPIQVPIGTKTFVMDSRCTSFSYAGDSKAGTTKGSYTFEGKLNRV